VRKNKGFPSRIPSGLTQQRTMSEHRFNRAQGEKPALCLMGSILRRQEDFREI
jgi:hypothetical protein